MLRARWFIAGLVLTGAGLGATSPHVVLIVGGPSGRVVLGTSTSLRNTAERRHVMLVITNSGTRSLTYTLRVRA